MGSATATAFGPATRAFVAVLPPYLVVVPYSKYQSVCVPCGFTTPATTTEVGVTLLTAPVDTEGGAEAAPAVPMASPREPTHAAPTRRSFTLARLPLEFT